MRRWRQRTRELGVRLALGATRRQIGWLVAGQGGRQLAIGLGAGLVLAVAMSRGFAAAVEAIPLADVPLLGVVATVIGLTVAAAVAVPARRAIGLEIARAEGQLTNTRPARGSGDPVHAHGRS